MGLLFLLPQCRRNASLPSRPDEQSIRYIGTELGGCNGMRNPPLGKTRTAENDTVYYEWKDDTLDFHVGIDYICCAKFGTEHAVDKDTLRLKVRDACTHADACYCRCNCYYTFDFLFTGSSNLPGAFEASLYDAMWDTTCILARKDRAKIKKTGNVKFPVLTFVLYFFGSYLQSLRPVQRIELQHRGNVVPRFVHQILVVPPVGKPNRGPFLAAVVRGESAVEPVTVDQG